MMNTKTLQITIRKTTVTVMLWTAIVFFTACATTPKQTQNTPDQPQSDDIQKKPEPGAPTLNDLRGLLYPKR